MTPTRRTLLVLALLLTAAVSALGAHDMFLKPHATVTVALLNGTFEASENVITRQRMRDVSVVRPGGRVTHPPASSWRDTAAHHPHPDSVDTALLELDTGDPGTYVVGVSTRARVFTLSAREFDDYLAHDGVLDVLEQRRDAPPDSVTERYSKHVKALVQVGEARSSGYAHELGYPVEFVPLRNPYELQVGDPLEVRFLRDGRPVPDHLVYASYEGHHSHDASDGHVEAVRTRTDAHGVARIELSHAGKWYVRAIHMVERPDEAGVDYESNWATLTFEIR